MVLWVLGGHMVHGSDLGSPPKCQILAVVLQTYEHLLQLRLGLLIPGHSQRRRAFSQVTFDVRQGGDLLRVTKSPVLLRELGATGLGGWPSNKGSLTFEGWHLGSRCCIFSGKLMKSTQQALGCRSVWAPVRTSFLVSDSTVGLFGGVESCSSPHGL